MFERFRGRAEFLLVYIREAHPEDGRSLPANRRAGVDLRDPKDAAERLAAASACVKGLGLTMTALADGMDDAANLAYAAWPERLYVVGKDGRIAYAGGMGPFHFDPEECEGFLEGLLD